MLYFLIPFQMMNIGVILCLNNFETPNRAHHWFDPLQSVKKRQTPDQRQLHRPLRTHSINPTARSNFSQYHQSIRRRCTASTNASIEDSLRSRVPYIGLRTWSPESDVSLRWSTTSLYSGQPHRHFLPSASLRSWTSNFWIGIHEAMFDIKPISCDSYIFCLGYRLWLTIDCDEWLWGLLQHNATYRMVFLHSNRCFFQQISRAY